MGYINACLTPATPIRAPLWYPMTLKAEQYI
jgi:hypothetical protein